MKPRLVGNQALPPAPQIGKDPGTKKKSPEDPAGRDVLIAVTGESPAILTETIWMLATVHPWRMVPHEVVAITTTVGKDSLEQSLLRARADWGERSVWSALAEAIASEGLQVRGRLQLRFRLIEAVDPHPGLVRELADIRSSADNQAAADTILRVAQEACLPEENRVVASVAGGRKTLGAFLHSVMSLVGKPTDRVTHVLVESPYDGNPKPLTPQFFFPKQPIQELVDSKGVVHRADAAKLDLAELPFVALRHRFGDLAQREATYMGLVHGINRAFLAEERPITVRLEVARSVLTVNGEEYRGFPTHHSLLLAFYLHSLKAGMEIAHHGEAAELFRVWAQRTYKQVPASTTHSTRAKLVELVKAPEFPPPAEHLPLSEAGLKWLQTLSADNFKDPISKLRIWLNVASRRGRTIWQIGERGRAFEAVVGLDIEVL